jgi:hypothetical protein
MTYQELFAAGTKRRGKGDPSPLPEDRTTALEMHSSWAKHDAAYASSLVNAGNAVKDEHRSIPW